MTIPFWCLFAAVVLPYLWFGFAVPLRKAQFGAATDDHAPRSQYADLKDRAARAHGAHANGLEALAYFAPAVLVAHATHADPTWAARLAVTFIVCRVIHGFMYVADIPPARTAFFAIGLLSSFGLFILSAQT